MKKTPEQILSRFPYELALYRVAQASILQSMAAKKNTGTEVKVLTYGATEDAVVPDGWDILSVEYDRQMAVTRVTVSRSYDAERTAKEREESQAQTASPTYPQPAGASPSPAEPPSTSYTWGTIDTTKVQNVDEVKRLGPTIAEQESAGKEQKEKDATEVATELNRAALDNSAEPAHTSDKPVDTASKEEAAAAGQSPAASEVLADTAKSDKASE